MQSVLLTHLAHDNRHLGMIEALRKVYDAKELADELRRFLNDEPIHARPIGPTARLWRWCRRKPALATLGTIVLVKTVF